MADMLSSALEYARRGWYVFPCREKPGDPYVRSGETIIPKEKQPYVGKGLHEATRDEEQIRAWWGMWNDALIGVNAGKSGLFVVDIDKKHVNGFDTYSQWGINDIAGLQTITPSGGMHIIFTGNGKTSTNPNTGIDTRGEGGYFIAPPSEITGGEFIGIYKAYNDWSKKPGIIPDGLLSKLFPDNTVEYVRGSSSFQPDGKKQLSRASLSFLTNGAPEGGRNTTLFKVLADFAGCGYTMEEAREIVKPASTRTGLPGGEFEQVLSHAFSKPRTAAIPDSIQEKIMTAGKKVASQITHSEQEIIEDALIACMLIDNTNIPIINDILSYEDFQGIKNRIIYKAINQLYQTAGGRIDYLVAYDAVSKETSKITLEDISSLITKYFIDTDNAIVYANIIKEKSAIRKIEAMLDDKEKYLIEGSLLEIVTSIEQDLTRISLDGGARSSLILDAAQATEVVKTQTEKILKGELQQLKIGFPDYDNMLGGFYPNELVIIAGRAGEGKCLKKGTLVIMHDGSMKKVEDIVVGDKLMGVDSQPRTVIGLSSGIDMLYTIKQNRAQDYTVNSNHILSLKQSAGEFGLKHGDIVNINIRDYLKLSKHRQRNLKGYKVGVEFQKKDLPVAPYFLGLWLGDGTSAKPSITTNDSEVVEYIYNYAKSMGMTVSCENKTSTSAVSYRVNGGMLSLLRDNLGVLKNKHIPFDYLTSGREDRLQLLAGIIDTDGSVTHGGYEITQKNRELLKQVKWLADSLGFRTSKLKEKICTIKSTGFSGSYYRITIHGQMSEIPVKINRKKIAYADKRIDQRVTGIEVVEDGVGEYYGFEVDQDGLFLLEDFTVTHNSALALSILNNVGIIQNKPSLMFSLEMSTTETICRLICQLTGLRFKDVYQGNLTVDEWKLYRKAVEQISDSKLYFDDGYGLTVPELRSKIRKLMDKDLSLVVVDQLEQIRGYEGLQTHLQFDKIAYDIKNMTLEFNVPIILNHQLNRGVTDRRLKNPEPILSDLNQAGEKPANQVWAITHHKDDVSGQIVESKIKILKNRNGPRFDFPVLFLGERLLFVSPTREEDSRSYEHRNNIQQTFSRAESYEEPDYVGEEGADSAPWY